MTMIIGGVESQGPGLTPHVCCNGVCSTPLNFNQVCSLVTLRKLLQVEWFFKIVLNYGE
jgi:hypothetical protein